MKNKNNYKQVFLDIIRDLKAKNINSLYINGRQIVIHDCAIPKQILEVNSFKKGLDLFIKDEILNDNLAKKTIVMNFLDIIKKLLQSDSPSTVLIDLLDKLERKLSNTKDFNVYVPLRGIKLLNKKNFKISEISTILFLDENSASELIPDKEIMDFFPCTIQHTIHSADFLKAIDQGVELSKLIVHFLRFVDYQGWDEGLLGLRLPGHGPLMEELRVIAVPIEPGNLKSYNWRLKEANDEMLIVDDMFLDDANSTGFEVFSVLLMKYLNHQLNQMETQIIRAIVWFGESKIDHDDSARFLKLTLVLECLLNLSKNEPVTVSLSDRVAFLLGNSLETRLSLYERVQSLYSIRSEIVHNGSSDVDQESLFYLEHIVSELIILFLTNPEYSSIKTKKELRQKFNNIKFSD
ncbi:HEPN domain-containing protein [Metabacillus idriensis]|uniref:HEPN domain-containing protein n=1 Tax=Metabacillus idriensis TaxID=324768 RepID=UPI00174A3DCA|nr:HEPN domain-containing protein [Metabacillus idriensis]